MWKLRRKLRGNVKRRSRGLTARQRVQVARQREAVLVVDLPDALREVGRLRESGDVSFHCEDLKPSIQHLERRPVEVKAV